MKTSTSNRRDFIKHGLIGTAGVMIGGRGVSARSYAAINGANERINVAVIGIRNQGTVHLQKWCALKVGGARQWGNGQHPAEDVRGAGSRCCVSSPGQGPGGRVG